MPSSYAACPVEMGAAPVGLVPDGRYSLFENHFSGNGVKFTPLDGTATTNSFTASRGAESADGCKLRNA